MPVVTCDGPAHYNICTNFGMPIKLFLIIGSASYIVREVRRSVRERERERERYREREREIDGSDVIIVALKLAMSLHFPMPKIRTIAEFTLSLAKNSHFSFLPSHFLSQLLS